MNMFKRAVQRYQNKKNPFRLQKDSRKGGNFEKEFSIIHKFQKVQTFEFWTFPLIHRSRVLGIEKYGHKIIKRHRCQLPKISHQG